MEVVGEREVFCDSEGTPRGCEPLNRRVISKVHEKDDAFKSTGPFKIIHKERCFFIRNPHGNKNHREFFSFPEHLCLSCDLGGKLVCRQTGTGEYREFLTPDKSV